MIKNRLSIYFTSWENNPNKILMYIIIVGCIFFAIQFGRSIVTDPAMVPLVLVTLLILAATLLSPKLLVILLLIFVPLHPFARVLFLTDTQALWREVVIGALTFALLTKFAVNKKRFVKNPLNLPLICFVVIAVLQLPNSPNLLQGVIGLRTLVLYLPFCLFVINNPFTIKQIRIVLTIIIVFSLLLALFWIYQYIIGLETVETSAGRPGTSGYTVQEV